MSTLFNSHKPTIWSALVGQDSARIKVRTILTRKNFTGGALLLSGPSSAGKTSMAACICTELRVCPFYGVKNVAAREADLSAMQAIEADMHTLPMVGQWKVYILDEAHALTKAAQDFLLGLLERMPAHRLIVGTTTETSCFTPILASRWLKVRLEAHTEESASEIVRAIASAEGIVAPPQGVLAAMLKRRGGNVRELITDALELGEVF